MSGEGRREGFRAGNKSLETKTNRGGNRNDSSSRTSFASAVNCGHQASRMITPQSSGQPPPAPCEHKAVMKDLCINCGVDIRTLSDAERRNILSEATVSMIHTVPELKVSADEAEKLGQNEQQSLLKSRKLVLLVDLDQTIIHTTNDVNDVQQTSKSGMKDVHAFPLYPPGHPLHSNHPSNMYHTKLRPHIVQFLKNVSNKYQMHICTFGSRMYAHTIAGIIEGAIQRADDEESTSSQVPNACIKVSKADINEASDGSQSKEKKSKKKIFEDRILSRDECLDPTSKTGNLRSLFPVGDKMVAIIDDREDVWNFSHNVIAVKPYHYFKNTGDINNPFKSGRDASSSSKSSSSASSSLLGMGADIKNLNTEADGDAPSVPNVEALSQEASTPVDSNSLEPSSSSSQLLPSSASSSQQQLQSVPSSSSSQTMERLSAPSTPTSAPSTPKSDGEGTPTGTGSSPSNSDSSPSTPTNASHPSTPTTPASSFAVSDIDKTPIKESEGMDTLSSESSNSCDVVKVTSKSDDSSSGPAKDGKSEDAKDEKKEEEEAKDVLSQQSSGSSEDASQDVTLRNVDMDTEDVPVVDEEDDYLLYLEDILNKIHEKFYEEYDEKNRHATTEGEVQLLPDLKQIIPNYRRSVLAKVSIVFSGIIPTNVNQERHRMYQMATLLGAKVTKDVMTISEGASPLEATTHVIGAKFWTEKIKKADKYNKSLKGKSRGHRSGHRQIFVVNPLWLTTCFERWEKVDENLFLLKESDNFQLKDNVLSMSMNLPSKGSSSKRRQQDVDMDSDANGSNRVGVASSAASGSKVVVECPVYDPVTGKRIVKKPIDTSEVEVSRRTRRDSAPDEPFMFSMTDIQKMGKEVDDACSEGSEDFSDDDDEDEEDGRDKNERLRKRILDGDNGSDDEDADLDPETPKGWNQRKRPRRESPKSSPSSKINLIDAKPVDDESTNDGLGTVGMSSSSSSSSSSGDDSDESLDEDAAFLEQQFLSNE